MIGFILNQLTLQVWSLAPWEGGSQDTFRVCKVKTFFVIIILDLLNFFSFFTSLLFARMFEKQWWVKLLESQPTSN